MWRAEFQQLESEYINKRPSAITETAPGLNLQQELQICVTRGQHG